MVSCLDCKVPQPAHRSNVSFARKRVNLNFSNGRAHPPGAPIYGIDEFKDTARPAVAPYHGEA